MSNEYCQFCQILQDHQKTNINKSTKTIVLNENQQFFAFEDYNKAAKQHVLVCTKEHVETALDINQLQKLMRMKDFCIHTLKMISSYEIKDVQKETKFCFHLKPHISVYHVHLHCFLLPFIDRDKSERLFGYLGKSIEQILQLKKTKI